MDLSACSRRMGSSACSPRMVVDLDCEVAFVASTPSMDGVEGAFVFPAESHDAHNFVWTILEKAPQDLAEQDRAQPGPPLFGPRQGHKHLDLKSLMTSLSREGVPPLCLAYQALEVRGVLQEAVL